MDLAIVFNLAVLNRIRTLGAAAITRAELSFTSARNHARVPFTVPVSLTLLRGSSPESLPARAVNMSEGGMNTVVAGEVRPHELIGVEFRLPDVGIPVKAKAWVRHQSALRCGLEFTGLSYQQRAMIRYWLQRCNENTDSKLAEVAVLPLPKPQVKSRKPILGVITLLGFISLICMVVLGLWYWQSEWSRIESHLPSTHATPVKPVSVPAEDVEKRLLHRVDPIYPDSVRPANLSGVVKLNVVIGTDGTVSQITPLSGSEAFQQAAIDAVKWWRFQPYMINGRAVPVQTTIGVEFRP
ncbi:MAG TPA: TonB family protein [Terriglobales bacterium]